MKKLKIHLAKDSNQNPIRITHLFLLHCFILIFTGIALKNAESSPCPQPRITKQAPAEIYSLKNPLKASAKNIKKGKVLYQTKAKPMACKHCHGINGEGNGPMAKGFNPPPRNFTCAKTINGVPDGQLFWIIKNSSPGTGMISYENLKDKQVWQIILYIRQWVKK